VNITKGNSPDPVPSWLEDVDDDPASAGPASAAAAASLQDRMPATTDGAHGSADATDDAQADAWSTPEADDESTATWRTSAARPASGTLTATWSALGFEDSAPDEDTADAAEASRAAADAPRSWGDASWKSAVTSSADSGTNPADDVTADDAGTGPDVDAAETASGTQDVGIVDAATGIDATDAATGIDATDADRASGDGAGLGDIEGHEAGDTGLATSGPADAEEGEAGDEAGTGDTGVSVGAQEVTVVPGVPRYHDPNCILIRFMPADDVRRMSVPEAEEAGCTPCGACQSE
jgi:hypothetical protein